MYIARLARMTSGGAGWRGPAMAVLLTAVAAAARAAVEPLAPGVVPFATFYVSTLLAALFGGVFAGALAAVLGAAVAMVWFVPPAGSPMLGPSDAVNLVLFLVTQAAVVVAAAVLRTALARAAHAERALQGKVAELEALMDLAPVGIWFARAPEVREVTRNRFARELLRVPPGSTAALAPAMPGAPRIEDVELRRGGRAVAAAELPLQRAMRGEESHNEEYEAVFADGSSIALLSNARPVRDARGRILGAVSASLDVTTLKRTEAALRDALARSEMLQREADHRIKNSLQLVAGVLRLQRRRVQDEAAAALLDEAVARVGAVAEAHAALQQSPDLRFADVGAMVGELCRFVGRLNPAVAIRCQHGGPAMLEVDRAIPLGLVVTELLTNAVRHAYPDGVAGTVQVRVALTEAVLEIVVQDEGVGMAEQAGRPGSLGRELVRTLSARIGARIETHSAAGQGTRVVLTVPCATPGAVAEETDGALAPG